MSNRSCFVVEEDVEFLRSGFGISAANNVVLNREGKSMFIAKYDNDSSGTEISQTPAPPENTINSDV